MEKNMKENFEKLNERIIYSLHNTDLEKINYELSKINEPTLLSGVGGSSVVSDYVSKILSLKNKIITKNCEPRDFIYMDLNGYKNVLACSYSGNNYGTKTAFTNDLKHYLLSSNKEEIEGIVNLAYSLNEKEKSFISLSATMIPCSILLNYYLNGNYNQIIESLNSYDYSFNPDSNIYEIFTGYETSTARKFLESTITEAGIGTAVVHDKYSYCHGRSTLSKNNIAIYFNNDTELDKIFLEELKKYFKDIVILNFEQSLKGEYELLLKCLYLTKYIAEYKQLDLSGVDYNPIVKKVYKFSGTM